jgi:hypothetical protein
MVALSEDKFHHPGSHGINSGTTPQRGRRSGESAQPEKDLDQGCSEPSVSSVAGNYFNGGFMGNMPNGRTDYIWIGWPRRPEFPPVVRWLVNGSKW